MYFTRKVNGNIKGGTRRGEKTTRGEKTIMSMESMESKDMGVLQKRARVSVESRGHRETVYGPVKFAILHRVSVS